MLVEVAGHCEDTGFEVPCLIVAAKDDLDSFPMAIQDSTRVYTCSVTKISCIFYYASLIVHKLFLVFFVVCMLWALIFIVVLLVLQPVFWQVFFLDNINANKQFNQFE